MNTRTERLHYTQSPALECQATVTEIIDNGIVTDITVFHPDAGGQPCDHGTINGIPVEIVEEDKDKVIHKFKEPHSFKIGDKVSMSVDVARRHDHAQQHTGQHILSRVCEDMFQASTGSFHMPEQGSSNEMCTIDLSVKLTPVQLAEAERKANEIIQKNIKVKSILCLDETTLEPYRKEARSFPKNLVASPETPVRIVNIEGFDSNPCCGTHVSLTGEVGVIKIFKQETSRGGVRIHFMSGMRCFMMIQKYIDTLNNIGTSLSTSACDSLAACNKLKDDLRVEKKSVTTLTDLAIDSEVKKLSENIKTFDGKFYIHIIPDTIAITAKEMKTVNSKLEIKPSMPLMILGTSGNTLTLFLIYNGTEININELVNNIKTKLSCKGGGARGMYTFQVPLTGDLKTSEAVAMKLKELE